MTLDPADPCFVFCFLFFVFLFFLFCCCFAQLEERMHGARGRRAARHIDLYPVVRSGPDRSLSFDFILQMVRLFCALCAIVNIAPLCSC